MSLEASRCPLCGEEVDDLLAHWDTPDGEGCSKTPDPELLEGE